MLKIFHTYKYKRKYDEKKQCSTYFLLNLLMGIEVLRVVLAVGLKQI